VGRSAASREKKAQLAQTVYCSSITGYPESKEK
jgi:hypothetical protein